MTRDELEYIDVDRQRFVEAIESLLTNGHHIDSEDLKLVEFPVPFCENVRIWYGEEEEDENDKVDSIMAD